MPCHNLCVCTWVAGVYIFYYVRANYLCERKINFIYNKKSLLLLFLVLLAKRWNVAILCSSFIWNWLISIIVHSQKYLKVIKGRNFLIKIFLNFRWKYYYQLPRKFTVKMTKFSIKYYFNGSCHKPFWSIYHSFLSWRS
jgi:hypothetical protein